jgi:hypothetical protein
MEPVEISQYHFAFNQESSKSWDLFSGHRRQVMLHILEVAKKDTKSVGFLGAGNCNDIDLETLSLTFETVHLIDIDLESMHSGVRRQKVDQMQNIFFHPVEITGIYNLLSSWIQNPPGDAEVIEFCEEINRGKFIPENNHNGFYDVVVSLCTQSQISWSVKQVGLAPKYEGMLIIALRNAHIRFILYLLKKDGFALLINDITSFSCKKGEAFSNANSFSLLDLMEKVIDSGTFFEGNNPRAIIEVLKTHPKVAKNVVDICVAPPWLWHFSEEQLFLVSCLKFHKKPKHCNFKLMQSDS